MGAGGAQCTRGGIGRGRPPQALSRTVVRKTGEAVQKVRSGHKKNERKHYNYDSVLPNVHAIRRLPECGVPLVSERQLIHEDTTLTTVGMVLT